MELINQLTLPKNQLSVKLNCRKKKKKASCMGVMLTLVARVGGGVWIKLPIRNWKY